MLNKYPSWTIEGYFFLCPKKKKYPLLEYSLLCFPHSQDNSTYKYYFTIIILVSQMNTSIHLIIDNFFTASFVKVFHGITATLLFHGTLTKWEYTAQCYILGA